MRIVFFGTSSFAAFVLQELVQTGCDIIAVVTRPDRPQGRKLHLSPSPVKETLLSHFPHLPLFQPEKASAPLFCEQLKTLNPDLFVVVAYGEIIKQNLLDLPKKGCINIHASLLPHFRGAAPMQRALMAGVKETGITIIEMTAGMDAGPILDQASIPVPPTMTLGELEAVMRPLAASLVLKVIHAIAEGSVQKQEQDHTQATFAPKLTAEEEKIVWTHSATHICNQIRAFSPTPGAWCTLQIGSQQKRLKIKRATLVLGVQQPPASFVPAGRGEWIIACGQDAISLQEVQLEGKKAMSAAECLRGLPADARLV